MPSHQFTAAAERAIASATAWTGRADSDELSQTALLMGLLAEPECRAAAMLATQGIDEDAVRGRWPELNLREAGVASLPGSRLPDALLSVAVAAEQRLWELPRPLELATEHLLLGLVVEGGEAGLWLIERGLSAGAIEAEIHRLYGFNPAPLVDPMDAEVEIPVTPVLASSAARPAALPQQTLADENRLLRIVDAAANRAGEGLRVVEDYARFALDDRFLTEQLKSLRHELRSALVVFPLAQRLAGRETQADVGVAVTTAGEQTRDDLRGIVAANFARLAESLRTLEECAKLRDAAASTAIEQLRYRAYTLQRAVDATDRNRERLERTRLYVLVDGGCSAQACEARVAALVAAGVHAIQLRDKSLADRALLKRARMIRRLTRGTGTLLIVNDRPDIAALAEADGVHVGQEELTVKDARTIVGPAALVGVSTHSIEQARQAVLDGADYLGAGPTFPSGTKRFESFPGLELLRAVSAEISLPAFAIGGIHVGNLAEVLATGSSRVAVSGAINLSPDPAAAVGELLRRLEASRR